MRTFSFILHSSDGLDDIYVPVRRDFIGIILPGNVSDHSLGCVLGTGHIFRKADLLVGGKSRLSFSTTTLPDPAEYIPRSYFCLKPDRTR